MLKILVLAFILIVSCTVAVKYKPSWDSIDSRPLPKWYDDCKLGIFSHWGVYSVPGFGSEWFWWYWQGQKDPRMVEFVSKHYRNDTTYGDFAKEFTAEDLDTENFAAIIKASGARYFVLTSKHHEGFTLWPSKTSWNWNAVDVGPHRDLVKELSESIRKADVHFGVYFSLFDCEYVETVSSPQLLELVNNYQPDVIWSDGDWDRTPEYWQSKEFLAWLYNESPIKDKVVVNDRWGKDVMGKHGGFLTYQDHYDPGKLLARKWENCLTLDRHSWGYRRDIKSADILTLKEIVSQLARTISCGGNMLLNIGPDKQGRIIPIFEERLRQLGQFVSVNEEAIFGSKPWIHQNDTDNYWYTSVVRDSSGLSQSRLFNPQAERNTVIYAFLLQIPKDNIVRLSSIKATENTRISLLGTQHKFQLKKSAENVVVDLSQVAWQEWPSTENIVLKIEFAASSNFIPLAIRDSNVEDRLRNNPNGFESSEEVDENTNQLSK